MKKPFLTIGSVLLAIVVLVGIWLIRIHQSEAPVVGELPVPAGKVDLKVDLGLAQPFVVPGKGTTITPSVIQQDSRCPSDVTCVWAGKVVVGLIITSPSGPSNMDIEPGQTVTTETLAITLDEVLPYPISKKPIGQTEYILKFSIKDK